MSDPKSLSARADPQSRGRMPLTLALALAAAVWVLVLPAGFLFPWYNALFGPQPLAYGYGPLPSAGQQAFAHAPLRPLALILVPCLLWAVFTPAIFRIARRMRAWGTGKPPLQVAAGQIAVATVIILLEAGVGVGYFALVRPLFWSGANLPPALLFFRGSLIVLVPTYVVTALASGMVDLARESRDREIAEAKLATHLAEAQLAALRWQLHPHFLFNSLNAVAGLVREHRTREAVQALVLLSDLLRGMLDNSRGDEVPLRAELEFIQRYLELERLRFADRLRIEVVVSDEAREALVPTLVLQPLVENAIRHGVARRAAAGLVRITARRRGDMLALTVEDDGPGLPSAPPERTGLGLANTRGRLEQLYGEAWELELEAGPAAGVVVTILLPFHVAEPKSVEAPAAVRG